MLFKDVSPFIRYARYMKLDSKAEYAPTRPYDARFFYAQKGTSQIMAGGCLYEMKEGAVLIVNAGVEYRIIPSGDDVCYIVLNFDYTRRFEDFKAPIPPAFKDSFDEKLLLEKVVFEDVKELGNVLYVPSVPEIEKRLTIMVHEYTVKLIYHEIKTSSLMSECLAECIRKNQGGIVSGDKPASMDVIAYIHNNISENITNIEIGRIFGYHPNYISSIIKQSTGMPLHKYLIRVRLMKAVELLENSHRSIGEIASLCGFCDIGYFSSYFKKYFGTIPSEYRR